MPSKEIVRTKMRGWLLWTARLVWLAAILFALLLFIEGVPATLNVYARGFLGLDFRQAVNGEMVLLPKPNMPSFDVGIRNGDVLLALNGQAITPDVSQTRVERMLNDPSFARVTFQVRHPDGTTSHYTVARDTRGLDQAGWLPEAYARYSVAMELVLVASFTALALLIFLRRGDDWFALLMAAALVYFAVRIAPEIYNLVLLEPQWMTPVNLFLAAGRTLLIVWLCLFPNGHFVPRAARWLLLAAAAYYVYSAFAYDPYARTYYASSQSLIDGAFIVLGMAAQFYRYHRASTAPERQQTRWVLFGVAIAFFVYYGFQILDALDPTMDGVSANFFRVVVIRQPIIYLALMMVPLTMTISILRYHLWQIDILLNRTLVYVPLTAILAGVLAGSISLAQRFFLALTGEKSDLSAAIAAVVVVALFEPLKKWLQERVDRRFKEEGNPAAMLKPFEDMVRTRIFGIDLPQLAQRSLDESVRAFGAQAGQIVVRSGNVIVLTRVNGTWDEREQLSVPLTAQDQSLGTLSLGQRKSRNEYSSSDRAVLEQFAGIVAAAVAETLPHAQETEMTTPGVGKVETAAATNR